MTIAGKFINIIRHPVTTGLGTAALAAGLSAYDSAANEDYRNEGDQRIIAKALAAGTLAGLGSGAARYLIQKNQIPVMNKIVGAADKYIPDTTAKIRQSLAANPSLQKIPIGAITEALGVAATAKILGGFGDNTLGDSIADTAGMMQNTGVPIGGSWTDRANEWNMDKETAKQQAINDYQAAVNAQILERLSLQPVSYPMYG